MRYLFFILIGLFINHSSYSQVTFSKQVKVGAEQTDLYFPLLKTKRIALVANQTSTIGKVHLVDSLLSADIQISLVFSPEHGFRGTADAGQKIDNSTDTQTGLKLVSLYGKSKKPSPEDLADVELLVFDIQDVGVRYYTYISTLHYVMEACAEQSIPLLILDRPNPNGFYVDGPVLEPKASSFVGMHPVPLVHGLTIAEYGLMINGEGWLNNEQQCDLMIVPCKQYDHNTLYELPIKPSPNLPNIRSILLYPSLGLFEGTVVSVGRGTGFPFQVYGHPDIINAPFSFSPRSVTGAKYPKYQNRTCHGFDLRKIWMDKLTRKKEIDLNFLINAYEELQRPADYFNSFFYRLAGTEKLKDQIEQGVSISQIRASWQSDLNAYKEKRKKYLLYADFE